MDGKEDKSHLSFIGDAEMDIPLAHLPKHMESPKNIVDIWCEKMKNDSLTPADFKDHWKIWVPRFYALKPDSDWSLESDSTDDVLLENLVNFVSNSDLKSGRLNCLDHPQSICGKVLKIGEPCYSCRECGMDAACVLCVRCFKNSPHRYHNYKIGHSGGGGFCDCGDVEAWKSEPFCDIHRAGLQTENVCFPEDLAKSCRIVITSILKYAYQVLTLEHSPGLPHDLRLKESAQDPFLDTPDVYCTVLYNDESHTYEQVTTMLTKAVKCSQKDAFEYVTNIDREGRTVVKCSRFQDCQKLQTEIERLTMKQGKPLKVEVLHTHVIAHQIFAMKLIRWLQEKLPYSLDLRKLFSEVALASNPPERSIVEGILLKDSRLWKSARTHWHKLFLIGMLMEYESKKALAIVFTKHYGAVMKDFIDDDHDHSFSISSLSVQIFTTPTLSHYLITEEDVLFKLCHTFKSECAKKLKDGKLQFERNQANQNFKRASYILGDMKYLLGSKPEPHQWTDALRVSFLEGVSFFIELLCFMQGMESVVRQVFQHTEFEPEWESAFQLHSKFSPVISLIIDWCGSDRVVLIKAFRMTLSNLLEMKENQTTAVRELAGQSATCIVYDVSKRPVSIHLQVTRFLAGLYLHLEKYNLSFHSPEFQSSPKPWLVRIIEPVLRTQVMIAQVNAGMWRRNGHSLLNQVFSYHSVQNRGEMFDRDVVILQMGASLMRSDEFLIHVLNKFNLLEWADPAFEENLLKCREQDLVVQTISLVEEFLGLIIAVVGERYVPGVGKVTADDQLRKEIIQQLCIRPMAHSELNKTLPKDVHCETGLERVISDVAQFKKPSRSTGIGVYELKPEFYEQYNMYSYHYTKEELSKSEEEQRKRRENAKELVCCPPPKLPPVTKAFSMLPNLLQCDVMLHIMQTVLNRSIDLKARTFSEHQLQKVLHLIGYALQEEESKLYPYMAFTERSAKWNIKKLVKELSTSPRVEALEGMLKWTLKKFSEVEATKENVEVVTPPAPTAESSGSEKLGVLGSKEWRTKMAALKRAKVMADMTAMQRNFMKENAKLFEETVSYADKATECSNVMDYSEEDERDPVALGPNQTVRFPLEETYTCILCQEDSTVTMDGPALVLSAFVQKSTVHANGRSRMEKTDEVLTKPLFLPTSSRPQPHTSTCSHVMHSVCWKKYFDNVIAKENGRPYRQTTPMGFDVKRREFLCPLCECLSNTVLPLLPPLGLMRPQEPPPPPITFEQFVEGLQLTVALKSDDSTDQGELCAIEKIKAEMGEPAGSNFAALFPLHKRPQLSQSHVDIFPLFAQATFTKSLDLYVSLDSFLPLMAWNTCYYTIFSIERLLADQEKPLFGHLSSRQKDCLQSLTRYAGMLSSFWKDCHDVTKHALNLLTMIFGEHSKTEDLPCILDWDSFGMLVPLTLSIPNLFHGRNPRIPNGGLLELYVLKLIFLSHVTKILLKTKFQPGKSNMETDETTSTLSEAEAQLVLESLLNVRKCCANQVIDVSQLDPNYVWDIVKRQSIPFLRCCALFYHFLTDVPTPACLSEPGGDTYENLCKYLGLPITAQELLETSKYKSLSTHWLLHHRVEKFIINERFLKTPETVNGLVPLPHDYSELINMVATFVCPNSEKEDTRYPTMCLVCGEMLCSQSYCCQWELDRRPVGACTYHAHQCGANCGIFLRILDCEILLLAAPSRGCFIQAPYLDRYGETDPGLHRGNPLTLCPARYQKIKLLWLSHGLHEEITRAVESGTTGSPVTTQWHHL